MNKILTLTIASMLLFAGCTQSSTKTATPSTNPSADSGQTPAGKKAGFTASDVAMHATTSDCWFSIDGGVYDVTSYINVHPGGSELIIKYCGKDATSAFHTMDGRGKDHPTQATAQLQNYYKGVLN